MRRGLSVLLLLCGCSCPSERVGDTATPAKARALGAAAADLEDPSNRPSSLRPPAREPGPPREETAEQVQNAEEEARKLVAALIEGGVERREVCSMADIRGHRLFRRRFFKQARVWFEAAVRADPTFEPALLNAARATAAAGDRAAALRHLKALEKLGTPLARSRLRLAAEDPDLAGLAAKP
jgi:hypothetical protein